MSRSITHLLIVLCVAVSFVTRAEAAVGDCLGNDQAQAVIADATQTDEDCHTTHHAGTPADQDDDKTPQPHDEALCQCLAMVKMFTALPAPLYPDQSLSFDRVDALSTSFISADPQPGLRPPIV